MKYNFLEDKNTMAITTRDIIQGKKDVILVSHDEDDGMWQFLDGDEVDKNSAAIVSLFEMVVVDNTINELFDLPLGGIAYRENKNSEWIRTLN